MKKVLFQTHGLSYRGGAVCIRDYAHYNETLLGNKSVIAFDQETLETTFSPESTIPSVLESFQKRFEVFAYSSEEELNEFASQFDIMYALRAGYPENPYITSTQTAMHVVFRHYAPYADKNACVSEWLSDYLYEKCSDPKTLAEVDCRRGRDLPLIKLPFVPHIIDLPPAQPDKVQELRDRLNIPKNNFIFGRHGGLYEFDIPFVKDMVIETVNTRNDITFVLLNTMKFYEHPNIKYLDATFDFQEKSNFIAMCDAMLHAKFIGETFGIAMSEFLFHNKPVVSWNGGGDQNHVKLLKDTGLLYNDENDLRRIISNIDAFIGKDYKSIVSEFTPERVMDKFNSVFLS